MVDEFNSYVHALRNLLRFPKIAAAITQSSIWAAGETEAQDIETSTLLGPFFRLSPMQQEVANNYFSPGATTAPNAIPIAQNAVRMTLRNHQANLFAIADTVVRSGAGPREKMLDILKARGRKQLKTKIGYLLFMAVRSQMVRLLFSSSAPYTPSAL